uniref:Uncharacterized protein n=1 Tax=Romanomermis culicivorax TaxID=13658 RepID=A0A915L7S3_ROMCU
MSGTAVAGAKLASAKMAGAEMSGTKFAGFRMARYLCIWRKMGGIWYIYHDCFNNISTERKIVFTDWSYVEGGSWDHPLVLFDSAAIFVDSGKMRKSSAFQIFVASFVPSVFKFSDFFVTSFVGNFDASSAADASDLREGGSGILGNSSTGGNSKGVLGSREAALMLSAATTGVV